MIIYFEIYIFNLFETITFVSEIRIVVLQLHYSTLIDNK